MTEPPETEMTDSSPSPETGGNQPERAAAGSPVRTVTAAVAICTASRISQTEDGARRTSAMRWIRN